MAIGSPRWGGIRPDPYNPDSPDADNDGIIQEGTLFERPAGTRIVNALGLELEQGTPGNSLRDVGETQIVDREGRPVAYRQSWSGGTLSAGERNGTIGDRAGTIGSTIGNLDGPPPPPKRPPLQLRPTDVDKNGKPLRVFVVDDRRFHGVMPTDWAGFDNPAWREAGDHWRGSLRDDETPISANDPRLPDTLFYVTRNPSAQRDLGVVRADGFEGRVDLFYDRNDAEAALEAARVDDPSAGILAIDVDNIRTGAAVTLGSNRRISVFGDIRLNADAAPEAVRRKVNIPTPDSLDPIKERFDAEGFELYLVGGAVRDTLMGREIKDYDLATNATPDEIEAMLADIPDARLDLTGKDFAVVRVNMPDGEEYEIATFRRDVGEGRRPDEVEFTTIDEDVRRRDLTMNALFYDLSTNEIVDYVGGIDDIENGVVRAVGDPGERFREDPLRILRAFRFSGRTGWGMDSATVDAIRANSALRGVSGERVRDEFVRGIDSAVSPSAYIRQIDLVDNGTGVVWGQIFPGLNVSPERLPDDGSYGNRAALIASLLADNDIEDVKAVLKDRKFTNDEIADVELIMQARNINDGNVATLKNKFGKNRRVSGDDMRAFHRAQPETEDEIEPFLQFADAPPALTANELQERGIEPGPQFGAMLREAEEQRYREIRDNFSTGNPGHDEGEAPPLPDAPDKLFVGSSDEKNVRQSPDEVRAHMESAGFRMGAYDDGKIIGALRGDVDDPYDDRVFFTVEEGPDGGSTIRRLSIRDVESSELVQRVVRDRTDQWREGVASRGRAWHAVRAYDNNYGRALQGLGDDEPNPAQPVAETIDSIRSEGLVPSRITRVDSNSSIGDAIFLSESRDEISGFASPHIDADGNEQPTAFLEIDLGRAVDDGIIDVEDLLPEPFLFEGQVVRELSERLGGSVFPSDAYYDIPGVTEQSIVLRKPIPNDYISINGRNIRDVGMRDLKPNDSGSPAAAPETPSADLPESVVPEGRNWERPPVLSPSGFDQLLFTDTQSGHKAHVYSSLDEEVDEVLDRIYDTAIERGWGVKIANDFFWDDVYGPDANPRNRGQRGKGVTVYFPNSENWEEDALELHRLMEGYEPVGDGDIPEDVMIGNGVGMRYEYWRDPGEDFDMTDRDGQERYFQMYRPARAGHTPESLAVHNRYRELFPEVESDDPTDEIMGMLFGGRGRRGPTPGIPSNADRDSVSFKDADQRIDALTVNAPELASSPGEARRRLAPKEGEEQRGYAFVSPEALEIHQEETLGFIAKMETLEASRDLTDDEQDILAKARAHSAKIASDIDSGGGYYPLEIKTFDNDGEIETPESITKALNSLRFKQALDSVLADLAPEHRSSRIAISPVDSAGETLPSDYGFYYPSEDRIYLNPQFFEHIFQELGVPFEDYEAWANSRGTWKPTQSRLDWIDSLDMVGLKSYLRNRANPGAMDALPEGFNLNRATLDDKPILVKAIKEYEAVQRHRDLWNPNIRDEERAEMVQRYRAGLRSLVLHENFHGVHFRRDGTFKSPEFIEVRDKVIAALKASKLFDDLIDDEDDFYDDDNYFRYLMTWLGQGGPSARKDKKDLLKDLDRKSADKESIGAELFAEAMTHAAMGRKFPGSDILLEYITGERADRPNRAGAPDRVASRSAEEVAEAATPEQDFGLPAAPDTITGWDKDRLKAATHSGIEYDEFLPVDDLIDGVHLSEGQKSLSSVISETSEADLTGLFERMSQAYDTGSLSSNWSSEAGYQLSTLLPDIIMTRRRMEEPDVTPDEMERLREELAEAERAFAKDVVYAVQKHWGQARSELFHWDYLSERVQAVLGEEFGVSIAHEDREPNAGADDIWDLQNLLSPFVDAWVRGQYSSTQKMLRDKGITELNVYRGLYIPNRADEDPDNTSTRSPSLSSRGMESWSTDVLVALGFAGNQYGTANKDIEDLGDEELGDPTHILMHDVVPAQLILGIGDAGLTADDRNRRSTASVGEGVEAEVVVMGSRRPVDMLSNDFLKRFESPREESDNAVNFRIDEELLHNHLSSRRPADGSMLNRLAGRSSGPDRRSSDTDLPNLDKELDEYLEDGEIPATTDEIIDNFNLNRPNSGTDVELDSGAIIVYDTDNDRYISLEQRPNGTTYIEEYDRFDNFAYDINTESMEAELLEDWRARDARTVVFHGTTEEALTSIRNEGLSPRKESRGFTNRFVGSAVYTSESYDTTGYQYDIAIEIDLPRAIEDGVISPDSLDREPDFIRNDVLRMIADDFGDDNFAPDDPFDGTQPDTIVIDSAIPPEYLSINGEPLRSEADPNVVVVLPDSVGRENLSDFETSTALYPRRSMEQIKQNLVNELSIYDKLEAARVDAMSPERFKAELERVSTYLVETLQGGTLAMAVPEQSLLTLVKGDGKFKNQHETGHSRGTYDPQLRISMEGGFGVPDDTPAEERPKYGYIEGSGWDDESPAFGYGGVKVRFRSDVADRTTITFGDSLTSSLTGVRLTDIQDGSVDPERVATSLDRDSFSDVWRQTGFLGDYAETQMHGPLSLYDVEEIIIDVDMVVGEARVDDPDADPYEVVNDMIQKLRDYGVAVKVREKTKFGDDIDDFVEIAGVKNPSADGVDPKNPYIYVFDYDFDAPPAPDDITDWDRDRLVDSEFYADQYEKSEVSTIDGEGLSPDQKSLATLTSETTAEDAQDLLTALEYHYSQLFTGSEVSSRKSSKEGAALDNLMAELMTFIDEKSKLDSRRGPLQETEKERLAQIERDLANEFVKVIAKSWGVERIEAFHWDFLSERVQTVLGEEFRIPVDHTPREPGAGNEYTRKAQELLTPFVDAWARGQYSATQKHLSDNGITELSLFRGLYIPNIAGEEPELPSRREVVESRGLESWTGDLSQGIGFAGNLEGTANHRIETVERYGEPMGNPSTMLLHDVVPAQLVFGVGSFKSLPNASLGVPSEKEVVVLGSPRPVNVVTNDVLESFGFELGLDLRTNAVNNNKIEYSMNQSELFNYLSGSPLPGQTAEAADPVSTMKQNLPNLDVSSLPTGADGNPNYRAVATSTNGWFLSEDALNQAPLQRVYDALGEDFMVDGRPLKELMTDGSGTSTYRKLPSTIGGEDDWFGDGDDESDFDKLRAAISERDDIDEELRGQVLDDLDTVRTLEQLAADLSNAMPAGQRGGPPPRNPSDAPAAPEVPAPEEVQAKIDRILEELPDGFAEKFGRLQEQQQERKETVQRGKEVRDQVTRELQAADNAVGSGNEATRTENTPAAALKDKTAEVGNATTAKSPDIDVDDHEPVEGVNRGHAEIDELAVQAHQIADSLASPEHRDELADVLRNNPGIVTALENLRKRRELLSSLTGSGQLEYDQTSKTGTGYAGRELIEALIQLRGFDGKNLRVTEEELEQVIYVSGAVPLSRGGNVEMQKRHIENGDLPIGEGVDGAGLYFAVDEDAAPERIRTGNPAAHDAATYAGKDGGVIRGAISPSANMTRLQPMRDTVKRYAAEMENPGSVEVGEEADPLIRLRREWASNPETADLVEALDLMLGSASTDNAGEYPNGPSAAAILLGYDGMNSYSSGGDNRVILLNRTAMLVSNEILSDDDYRDKRPWDKLTERAKLISESLDVPIGLEDADRVEYILDETARRLEAIND